MQGHLSAHHWHRRLFAVAAAIAIAGAAAVGAASPAQAAPPADRWGFAYVSNPTVPAWTNLNPAYQATSPPSPVAQGAKVSSGRFRVRFPGLGAGAGADGNVHVTAVNSSGNFCEAMRWFESANDEYIDVACHAPGGALADTRFAVLWTLNTTLLPTTAASYASVQYSPAAGVVVQSYNSTGAGVTTLPVAPGVTWVVFEKVSVGSSLRAGNVQATAISRAIPRRCKIGAWDDSGLDIYARVDCYDASGTLVDTDFNASYHRERPVVAATGPPKYFGYVWTRLPLGPNDTQTNYNYPLGGYLLNTVTVSGADTEAYFKHLSFNETHAQVTAFGPDPNYCNIVKVWQSLGADLLVAVRCFDPTGNPAPSEAFVTANDRG